jgi:hypothetical protein
MVPILNINFPLLLQEKRKLSSSRFVDIFIFFGDVRFGVLFPVWKKWRSIVL